MGGGGVCLDARGWGPSLAYWEEGQTGVRRPGWPVFKGYLGLLPFFSPALLSFWLVMGNRRDWGTREWRWWALTALPLPQAPPPSLWFAYGRKARALSPAFMTSFPFRFHLPSFLPIGPLQSSHSDLVTFPHASVPLLLLYLLSSMTSSPFSAVKTHTFSLNTSSGAFDCPP